MAMLEEVVVVMLRVVLTWMRLAVDSGMAQHGSGRKDEGTRRHEARTFTLAGTPIMKEQQRRQQHP